MLDVSVGWLPAGRSPVSAPHVNLLHDFKFCCDGIAVTQSLRLLTVSVSVAFVSVDFRSGALTVTR